MVRRFLKLPHLKFLLNINQYINKWTQFKINVKRFVFIKLKVKVSIKLNELIP